jgi:putative hemolysin
VDSGSAARSLAENDGQENAKRLDRPGDPYCNMVDYPTPELFPQNPSKKRNFINSPSSVCEMLHKINCLHKPPRLVDFSLQPKERKMKNIFTFTIILMALTACAAPQTQVAPEPAMTDMPQANMPNPASVYCEQNGNKLEIVTAADGSQNGICIFPDGSACDEWAYYRGECRPASVEPTTEASGGGPGGDGSGGYMPPGTTEEIVDWWGVIKSTEPGAQFDDYFERQDLGQVIYFGIDSMAPSVKSQIEALRDSGKVVHLYGTLVSNVPDYNGSQILVDRIEVEE